ncbi:hypothetical protein WL83_04085 [Burkholderia ubonensis]|nr:hypothetical protein WL83_04085 [Burkholderia ubonensis]
MWVAQALRLDLRVEAFPYFENAYLDVGELVTDACAPRFTRNAQFVYGAVFATRTVHVMACPLRKGAMYTTLDRDVIT